MLDLLQQFLLSFVMIIALSNITYLMKRHQKNSGLYIFHKSVFL